MPRNRSAALIRRRGCVPLLLASGCVSACWHPNFLRLRPTKTQRGKLRPRNQLAQRIIRECDEGVPWVEQPPRIREDPLNLCGIPSSKPILEIGDLLHDHPSDMILAEFHETCIVEPAYFDGHLTKLATVSWLGKPLLWSRKTEQCSIFKLDVYHRIDGSRRI